jgi:hypothetical protein
MTPFSESQIDGYINEYVSIHQPLWEAKDYKQALNLIPSLKELVKNPFLMTLSLEVMPRMMDPGEHLSFTHVTKVGLYDHFIEHWLERGDPHTSCRPGHHSDISYGKLNWSKELLLLTIMRSHCQGSLLQKDITCHVAFLKLEKRKPRETRACCGWMRSKLYNGCDPAGRNEFAKGIR